ncbi:hypothetical protein [Blastochloris sulfoviridis]|uniref:Plug domain-containing protein n=1 Tax=Blastochloris sulfoviridis TaxID=50712 RepID=A0A5M6HYZ2_9HYPH|nr:hypothetical protein [Blastochloris sulfoviridis]KAA5601146.1 hypothetical protein F1193_10095 [Blastochloris sulfoviridis]
MTDKPVSRCRRPRLLLRLVALASVAVLSLSAIDRAAAETRTRRAATSTETRSVAVPQIARFASAPRRHAQAKRRPATGMSSNIRQIPKRGSVRDGTTYAKLAASSKRLSARCPSARPTARCALVSQADSLPGALLQEPNPDTLPVLDRLGIPAVDGVPPIVTVNQKRRPAPGFFGPTFPLHPGRMR